jgi:hypothetical protein
MGVEQKKCRINHPLIPLALEAFDRKSEKGYI